MTTPASPTAVRIGAAWVTALALTACAAPPPTVTTAPATGLEVSSEVHGGPAGLTLQVVVTAPKDATWTLTPPTGTGLTLTAGTARTEQVGDRAIDTRTYAVKGAPGSYVVDPVCAAIDGSDDARTCALPLYVDIGLTPDRSRMVDIREPEATWPRPPLAVLVGAGVLLVGLLAAAIVWWRRRPEPVIAAVAEEPPHVIAIRRWEALRDDPSLSDFDKALGLSDVFRAYAQAALGFPATAWSTTETLRHLESLDALPKMNVPRARRLLRATDRVKYAEARPGTQFFEDLEADLHAFIDQTRPRAWDEGAPR